MRQKDADRQDSRIKLINVHEVTQVDYHTQEDVIQCCMPIGQDKLVVNIKDVSIGIAHVAIAGIKEECTVRCCAKRGACEDEEEDEEPPPYEPGDPPPTYAEMLASSSAPGIAPTAPGMLSAADAPVV